MKPTIALIGTGWLGGPLLKSLSARNYNLIATTRHTDLASSTPDLNSCVQYLELDLESKPQVPESILNSDIIIYTIPPLKLDLISHFFNQISSDKKILITTSTSVYSREMNEVDEKTPLNPNTSNSPLLVETEHFLKSKFKNCTIVRPGGLYGLKRHPVYFLAGKNDLKNGDDFLHLASLNDCINGISLILEKNRWGEIFNFVCDLRITKNEYYTYMAKKLGLPEIHYQALVLKNHSSRLKISNEYTKKILGLKFEDPKDYRTLDNLC